MMMYEKVSESEARSKNISVASEINTLKDVLSLMKECQDMCPHCNGYRYYRGKKYVQCPNCHGHGCNVERILKYKRVNHNEIYPHDGDFNPYVLKNIISILEKINEGGGYV